MQESFCKNHDSHNISIIPISTRLSQSDIEKIYQICDIAWKNYFSEPLPNYKTMQVYCKGKLQIFKDLDRNDQIEIVKSVHVSGFTPEDIERTRDITPTEFENFVRRIVLFGEGRLLGCHGIGHAVRTAIMAQKISIEYVKNFVEFEKMSPRILLLSVLASLLHDIGRCFGGDGSDIFGATSAYVASVIMNEVGGFTDEEIEFVKEAIEAGCINERDVNEFRQKKSTILNEKQIIACIMGDADSFEFERFNNCKITYISVKKLGIVTKEGQSPDEILNALKIESKSIINRISEPSFKYKDTKDELLCKYNFADILRNELLNINSTTTS